MVSKAYLSTDEAVVAYLCCTCDTCLCRRYGVLANLHVVANLNEVVQLHALADDCRVGLGAVDTCVCTNLHVVLDYNVTQLGNLVKRAIGLGQESEAVSADNCSCVDDAVLTYAATLIDLHSGVECGAGANAHAIAHIYLRVDLCARLHRIAREEEIDLSDEAARLIARQAQGGMRDAISLLELCAGNRERITAELVNDTLGVGDRDASESIVRAIAASDFDTVFGAVDEVVRSSKDIAVFWQDLIAFYRDMLVVKTTKAAKNYLDLTDDEHEHLIGVASLFTKETLLYHCRILDDTLYSMQRSGFAKRTVAEMALVKMCDMSLETSADTLAARISKLENAIAAGNISLAAPVATETREEIKKAPQKTEEAKTVFGNFFGRIFLISQSNYPKGAGGHF